MKMLDEWKKVIPGGDNFLKRHKVCELHFPVEDVLKDYVTKLPDGTEHRIKRGRACLRKGAVPSIFSELDYKQIEHDNKEKKQKKNEEIILENKESFLSANGEKTKFEEIVILINRIPLPSTFWFANYFKNFIQWTSWSLELNERSKTVRFYADKTVIVSIQIL